MKLGAKEVELMNTAIPPYKLIPCPRCGHRHRFEGEILRSARETGKPIKFLCRCGGVAIYREVKK